MQLVILLKIPVNLNPLFHGPNSGALENRVWFSGWHPFKYLKGAIISALYPFSRLSIPHSSKSIHWNCSLLSCYPFLLFSEPVSIYLVVSTIGFNPWDRKWPAQHIPYKLLLIQLEILFTFADISLQFCTFCKLNKKSPHICPNH